MAVAAPAGPAPTTTTSAEGAALSISCDHAERDGLTPGDAGDSRRGGEAAPQLHTRVSTRNGARPVVADHPVPRGHAAGSQTVLHAAQLRRKSEITKPTRRDTRRGPTANEDIGVKPRVPRAYPVLAGSVRAHPRTSARAQTTRGGPEPLMTDSPSLGVVHGHRMRRTVSPLYRMGVN